MSTSVACDSDDGSGEVVAQSAEEVGGGLLDTSDLFPAVVAIAPAGGGIESRFCSGTLVTPNRVVSAAHCFTPNSVLGALDVLVVTHPGGVKTATRYTHRPSFAGGVQTNAIRTFATPGPTGGDSNGDIAVITLDSPVPDVTPMVVATPDDPCPRTTEFIGNLVGFGLTGAAPPSCGLVNADDRSWATSTEWEYDDPGVYSNNWTFTSYQGGLVGDSGGALLHGSRLCGVHSRHSGVTCAGPLGAIDANSYAAAIDDWDLTATTNVPLTELESVVSYVDPRTGEAASVGKCPPSYLALPGANAALGVTDSDSDGIPDLCDSCPYKPNFGQIHAVEPDLDGDGIPDKCDNCRRVANRAPAGVAQEFARLFPEPDSDGDGIGDMCDWCTSPDPRDHVFEQELANCNIESELAFHYPGLAAPPIVTLGPNYSADLAKYRAAFKLGTCDLAPCPTMTLGFDAPFPPGMEPQAPCQLQVPLPRTCGWALRNSLVHRPKPSPETVGEVGRVHAKWCECPFDVSTVNGRVMCQADPYFCRGVQTQFEFEQWRELETARVSGPLVDWSQAGPETYSYPMVDAVQVHSAWNFFALGTPYLKHKPTGGPFLPGVHNPEDASVHGMLWNAVREMEKFAPGSPQHAEIQERGNHYERGDASYEIHAKVFITAPVNTSLDLHYPCKDCPFLSLTNLMIDPTLVSPTLDVLPVLVSPTRTLVSPELLTTAAREDLLASQRGELRIVTSVESPGLLAELTGAGALLRGIVLRPTNGAPVRVLAQTSLNGLLGSVPLVRDDRIDLAQSADPTEVGLASLTLAEPESDQEAPGAFAEGEALVFSAEHGLLYRFGGKHPSVAATAWIYEVANGRWTSVGLDGQHRPGSVRAGTFQRADGYVYALDAPPTGPGGPVQLRRWRPGTRQFESVVRWTGAMKNFNRYWVVPSDGGDVYVVASKPGSSAIQRFERLPSGALNFVGVHLLAAEILERPFTTNGTIGFVVHAPVSGAIEPFSGVRLDHVAVSGIRAKPKGFVPSK
ncbi:MAG: trypsin-like serine protease [Polyangiaceae bacterium]|nr:trypsin-like serine protease [Polyangiaceae bacterium]